VYSNLSLHLVIQFIFHYHFICHLTECPISHTSHVMQLSLKSHITDIVVR